MDSEVRGDRKPVVIYTLCVEDSDLLYDIIPPNRVGNPNNIEARAFTQNAHHKLSLYIINLIEKDFWRLGITRQITTDIFCDCCIQPFKDGRKKSLAFYCVGKR